MVRHYSMAIFLVGGLSHSTCAAGTLFMHLELVLFSCVFNPPAHNLGADSQIKPKSYYAP